MSTAISSSNRVLVDPGRIRNVQQCQTIHKKHHYFDLPKPGGGAIEVDDADFAIAERITAYLQAGYWATKDSHATVHAPRAFDPAWLSELSLPLEGDLSAVVDKNHFYREAAELAATGRTCVYESIDVRCGSWYGLVALQLEELFGCEVRCTMYESYAGDTTLEPHVDESFGLILHVRGSKNWTLWEGASQTSRQVTTRQGDVLLLPSTVLHAVTTPEYSTHLVFAVQAHNPLR